MIYFTYITFTFKLKDMESQLTILKEIYARDDIPSKFNYVFSTIPGYSPTSFNMKITIFIRISYT